MAGTRPAKKAERSERPPRSGGASGSKVTPEPRVSRKAPTMSAASASVLVKVMTLISTAPGLMPRAWKPATARRMAAASQGVAFSGSLTSRSTYWANATATAAVAPDCTMSSSAQPWRKAASGWNASRKKAYWPPTLGTTVLSSAKTKAPKSAMTPPAPHTARMRNGVPTFCATTYGLMKMPEPMMPETTIIVASNSVRRRTNPGLAGSLMLGRSPCVGRERAGSLPQLELVLPQSVRRLEVQPARGGPVAGPQLAADPVPLRDHGVVANLQDRQLAGVAVLVVKPRRAQLHTRQQPLPGAGGELDVAF